MLALCERYRCLPNEILDADAGDLVRLHVAQQSPAYRALLGRLHDELRGGEHDG